MASHYRLVPRDEPSLLSLVIPAYNEQEVLPILRERLTAFMDGLPCPVEAILVNDGSRDRTIEMLFEWAEADSRVKIVSLARNFGHQIAVTAGLDCTRGDAIVIMDADLQDPPEVVHDMLAKYREGYDVVYGQRVEREGESGFKKLTAWAFYRIMRGFIHKDLPADAGDFRLVSRRCLDALSAMRETHRFLRGMVAWVGFAQTGVKFRRPARAAGETKYPLHKMLRFAWTAIVSFSPAPLRFATLMGFLIGLLGIGIGVYAVVREILPGYDNEPGWPSLIVTVCMIGAAILFSIGVLGEYLGRLFEEAKGRPLYVIGETANLELDHHVGPAPITRRDPPSAS